MQACVGVCVCVCVCVCVYVYMRHNIENMLARQCKDACASQCNGWFYGWKTYIAVPGLRMRRMLHRG